MLKKNKKMITGMFAVLMLFGGLMVSTPLQADAAVARCQTGGPANTVTYRITQTTGWRNPSGATGLSGIQGTLSAGTHVTRASGSAEHRTFNNLQYRRVTQGGHVRWVRSAHLSVVNTC